MANEVVTHQVRISAGPHRGKTLVFTQESPDRYTVFGLSPLKNDGILIERRKHYEKQVLWHDSGAIYVLGESDQWISHKYTSNSFYGVLAVGATPQQAYENTFKGFGA